MEPVIRNLCNVYRDAQNNSRTIQYGLRAVFLLYKNQHFQIVLNIIKLHFFNENRQRHLKLCHSSFYCYHYKFYCTIWHVYNQHEYTALPERRLISRINSLAPFSITNYLLSTNMCSVYYILICSQLKMFSKQQSVS